MIKLNQVEEKVTFINGNTFFKELSHPFHPEYLTIFPLQVVVVQQKHSKGGNQHHFHEHAHPSVVIDTCTTNTNK
jgi:hypothetical protein